MDDALGKYANYFEIRYTAEDFLLDFGQHYPDDSQPVCHTRIIVNPESARVLCDILRASIERYQAERMRKGPE